MTPDQEDCLAEARTSLAVAKTLLAQGHAGYAASRACYAMFHVAEALLLGKGLAFSSHHAVHAAFGEHFAKTGLVPRELHRHLVEALEVRHAGDYRRRRPRVTSDQAARQIEHAEEFLATAQRLLGPASPPVEGDPRALPG